MNTDLDLDGVFDFEEFNIYLTNPVNPDSDGDGLSDGHEISNSLTDPLSFDSDSDSDGFYWFEDCDDSDPNSSPISPELLDKKDNDCDGFEDEDYIDMDRDGDGLSDYDEVHIHDTMPLDGDTDGDCCPMGMRSTSLEVIQGSLIKIQMATDSIGSKTVMTMIHSPNPVASRLGTVKIRIVTGV